MCGRFDSWLTIAIAAAFLVIASTAFGLSAVQWLAFCVGVGVGVGRLAVSVDFAARHRRQPA